MRRLPQKYGLVLLFGIITFVSSAQLTVDFTADTTRGCSPLIVTFSSHVSGSVTSYSWKFNNGNTSSLANPTVSFSKPGKYEVTLTVYEGSNNQSITKTDFITVYSNPRVDFTANKTLGCAPFNVDFNESVASKTPIISYLFDFGDGNTSKSPNPSYTYLNAGRFDVTLLATDSNGCRGSETKKNMIVVGNPVGDFSASAQFSCVAPQQIDFAVNQLGNGHQFYLFDWSFGDGHTDTGRTVSNIYQSKGLYDVNLKISDTLGCSNTISKKGLIRIDKIRADFEIVQSDSCVPANVVFKNKSIPDTNVVFEWDFFDMTKSYQKEPKKYYSQSGTYSVKLVVYDNNRCSDTIVKTDSIRFYDEFLADFSVDTTTFCSIPFTVNFKDNTQNIVKRNWYFGNGSTASTKDPSVTFSSYGTYSARLKLENSHGCKLDTQERKLIYAREPGFIFAPSVYSGCKPLDVSMVITDTSFIKLSSWDIQFSNGDVKTGKKVDYTFVDTGIHTVWVTGSNARGCSAKQRYYFRVGTPPIPSFTVDKDIGCFDSMEVHFHNLTNDTTPNAQEWAWDFGDGNFGTLENPTYKYEDTGSYQVTLYAYNYGCVDSFTRDTLIKVLPPVVKLSSDMTTCRGQEVHFTHNSVGGHFWFWDFGDGDTSQAENPIHRYGSPGSYKVGLMIVDTHYNCRHKDSMNVTVSKPPDIKMSSNNHTGCAPLIVNFYDNTLNSESRYWDFGNDQYSSSAKPVVTYTKTGIYSITLDVTDSFGCSNSKRFNSYVQVSDITPKLSITPTSGCLPLKLELHDLSKSVFPLDYRKWDMGNGDVVITKSSDTTYTFSSLTSGHVQNDGYTVALEISDTIGCKYNISRKVFPTQPKAALLDSSTVSCGERTIHFHTVIHDTSVYKPYNLNWYVGNDTLNGLYFSKYYDRDTAFDVKIVLEDANGCTDTAIKRYYVNTQPPKAGFMADSATVGCPPLIVKFKDTSAIGGFGIKNYYWYFGDNSFSNIADPVKIYTQPGLYTVNLVIEDSAGCKDSVTTNDFVTIHGQYGTLNYSPLKGCVPYKVGFSGTSTGPVTYMWYFGDGIVEIGKNVEHVYEQPGFFKPILILRDSFGCDISVDGDDSIEVYPVPNVDFTTPKQYYCPNEYVSLFNLTSHDTAIINWQWDVGATLSSSDYELGFSNLDTGYYDVRLVAKDTLGCVDTVFRENYLYIYLDSINPEIPEILYVSTYSQDSVDLAFQSSNDSDFNHYSYYYVDDLNHYTMLFDDSQRFDTSYLIYNLYTSSPRCYILSVTDICLNASFSKQHCLIDLRLEANEDGNVLKWSPYIGWDRLSHYEIYRKESTDTVYRRFDLVNSGTQYLDTFVQCGKEYAYQVKAVEATEGYTSWSNRSSIESIKKPYMDRIYLARVSVEDTNVYMTWEPSNTNLDHEYLIYRSKDNFVFDEIARVDSMTFEYIDKQVNVNKYEYYYYVKLKELNCQYTSAESNVGKTILLDVFAELADRNIMNLEWTLYEKWRNGVDAYKVEYYNKDLEDFEEIKSFNDQFEFEYDVREIPELDHCFRITAIEKDNNMVISKSNIDCDLGVSKLFIPNSFTPNRDGVNDVFKLSCSGCQVETFIIFDRWGEIIYESHETDAAWDGTTGGLDCPPGVYYYHFVTTSHDYPALKRTGTVTLIR